MNREFNTIPLNISNSILTIGPDYRNHRGGIGAVLEVYSKYFEMFHDLLDHKYEKELPIFNKLYSYFLNQEQDLEFKFDELVDV